MLMSKIWMSAESEMIPVDDDDDFGVRSNPNESGESPDVDLDLPSTQEQATEPVVCNNQTQKNEDKPEQRRNPARERKKQHVPVFV